MFKGIWVAALLGLGLAATAYAEPFAPRAGIGLGLSTENGLLPVLKLISTTAANAFAGPTVYVPLQLTSYFRLEPSLSYTSLTRSTDTQETASSPSSTKTQSISAYTIGLGGYYVSTPTEGVRVYAGPRIAAISASEESSFANSPDPLGRSNAAVTKTIVTETTGFSVAGVVGAEYYPHPRLAVGAEAGISHTTFSNPTTTVTPAPAEPDTTVSTKTESSTQIIGTLFLRIFAW